MNVRELKKILSEFDDELTVELYDDHLDNVYVEFEVEPNQTVDGESRVTFIFSFDNRE